MNWKVGTVEWWNAFTELDEESGCVIFTNARPDGYRQVRYNGRLVLVHRLAYELVYGPIPKGMKACHRCDRPSCVNASHIFVGTQKDNIRDMFAKGRARPRGKATQALTDFPAVSGRVDQALSKSAIREQWLSGCHSTSYTNCRDAGAMSDSGLSPVEATERQQIRAILLGHRPHLMAAEPAPERLLAVATAAPCWPGVSARRTTGTRWDAEARAAVSLPGDRT